MSRPRVVVLVTCSVLLCLPPCLVVADIVVDTAWVRTYNGPGNFGDEPNDMAMDGSGNVYVTGWSSGGGLDYDFATIKYYPNGDTAWVRRYNGPAGGFDQAWALALDGSGNVYVVGRVDGNGSGSDFATVKYDVHGDTVWTRTYDGPGNDDDLASDVTVDASGNAYVAGLTWGIGTQKDYTTIKYRSDGDTAWVRRYNGPEDGWDWATAEAVDGSGNVHVTGFCNAGEDWSDGDYATIKYYPNGDTAWLRMYNGPADTTDDACAIALDDSGNVYVTGYSHGIGTGLDLLTIKYDPDGDTLWVRRYSRPGEETETANSIFVDGSRNVYVTGYPATIKHYPNGDTAWVRIYDPLGNYPMAGMDLVVDDARNVYVTGIGWLDPEQPDMVTVKYDSSGATVWATAYAGDGNGDDYGYAIAVDDLDNVYVTGRSQGDGTAEDYATIKYVQALRGDVNGDLLIDLGDAVYILNYLFKGGPAPYPLAAGDANCDGIVDIGDAVYILNYLFKGGPEPSC